MCRAYPPLLICSTLEREYAPQCVSEGSTSESEKSKEVGMSLAYEENSFALMMEYLP
jgi:hypothetical protein